MTQIQIRRDTEANWTSVNPTLALGEWGYDITNKVCKIGDGTTPWNTLPVYGGESELPIATDTTAGIVKPDGSTITVTADGTISATASGGTSDYTELTNKPKINSVELSGNKSLSDLGIQPSGEYLTQSDLSGYAQTSDIPTATSDLANDSGFITNSVNNLTNYTLTSGLAAVATSGSYSDLTGKPTIPSEYVLPTASASVLGGVKIGDGVAVTDDGTISVASVNNFKFWSGTQTAYNGIATKDPNTLYIITGE